MKKGVLVLLAALVALPSWSAASSASTAEPAKMFVGGGTFVSNGVFFPGTGVYDGENLQGMPLQVERGQDIELTNLDYGDLANCHQLSSYKKKRGRPLFTSKRICAPAESALVLTSVLKPGRYEAYCPVHTGMYAIIEVAS
jgi:hypothetical protein